VVTATIRSVLIRRWWLVLLDRIGGIVGNLIALLVKRKQLFLIMHNFTFPLHKQLVNGKEIKEIYEKSKENTILRGESRFYICLYSETSTKLSIFFAMFSSSSIFDGCGAIPMDARPAGL
jgi:hypothetical protein